MLHLAVFAGWGKPVRPFISIYIVKKETYINILCFGWENKGARKMLKNCQKYEKSLEEESSALCFLSLFVWDQNGRGYTV